MKNLRKDNKGFSLVELLVVIAIMVVLVGVVAPSLLRNVEKARESKDVQTLDTIAGVLQAALASEKGYNAADKLFTGGATKNFYSDIYRASTAADKTAGTADYIDEVHDSISLNGFASDFGSKLAKDATKGGNVFCKLENGRVKVWISKEATDAPAENSNVKYEVLR